MRYALLLLLLLPMLNQAATRMYQWTDPDSGRTHLSGNPPAWYRSDENGPRVFVFDNGRLVDDTGVEVSEAKRQALRQQALNAAGDNGENAAAEADISAIPDGPISPPQLPAAPEDSMPGTAEMLEKLTPQEEKPALSEQELAELRELIAEWEARNQQRARQTLESGDIGGQSLPTTDADQQGEDYQ